MAFPFPTKPSDDLRALFKYQRLKQHANDLKFSSIGPGGSLDVVDGNGNVIASFGDVGTGQGFGLLDGGTIKNIRDVFASDGRMTTAEGRLDSHASRIGAAEGRLDSHASRIGATENVANGVQSEVTSARGGFGSLNSRLNDHASRLGATENQLTQHGLRLNSIEQKVANLTSWTLGQVQAIRDYIGMQPPIPP